MKKKFTRTLLAGLFFLGIMFSGTSCITDNSLDTKDIQDMIDASLNGQWKIVDIVVKKQHWIWNPSTNHPNKGYYYCDISLPELTKSIFDEGAVIAYYKHSNNSKTALPFVQVFDYEYVENGVTYVGNYTENISCDFNLGSPSTVTFIIEASDRERFDQDLKDRNFQVVLIW